METRSRSERSSPGNTFEAHIESLKRRQPQKPDTLDSHERIETLRRQPLERHHEISDEEEHNATDGEAGTSEHEDDAPDRESESSEDDGGNSDWVAEDSGENSSSIGADSESEYATSSGKCEAFDTAIFDDNNTGCFT